MSKEKYEELKKLREKYNTFSSLIEEDFVKRADFIAREISQERDPSICEVLGKTIIYNCGSEESLSEFFPDCKVSEGKGNWIGGYFSVGFDIEKEGKKITLYIEGETYESVTKAWIE
ncbi:MAG: hypothetical protein WC445_04870 [Patescibacteria group bacterium]